MPAHTTTEKNKILRDAFAKISDRVAKSAWTSSPNPYSDLYADCRTLIADPEFSEGLTRYLAARAVVRRSIEMFFTHIAMAARAQWQDAPIAARCVAARGWFLGRWIPTFLIIDGPIGRFLFNDSSPMSRIPASSAVLTAARDFLNDRTFRLLRNGFAHWAFHWEVIGPDSYVVAYDWERDLPTAKLHLHEADAFHIAAFALIEVLDEVLVSRRYTDDA